MATKKQLHKKILLLEYITIAWNVVEGIISITIGLTSGSISLVAFGLESSIEVFSSSITVWELKGTGNGREKSALKMISVALLIVAIYIAFNAIKSFSEGHRPKPTVSGIICMFLVTITMILLGSLKRNLGKKMKDPVILAEANFTLLDAALSSSILCGLILNALMGWWWVDQLLALVIAGNAFREGVKGIFVNFKDSSFLFVSNSDK